MKEHFIKNKNSNDFTETCKAVYHIVNSKYGYTARITDIFEMLKIAFGITEWGALDYRLMRNGQIQSYLMDRQQDWMSGKDVDFTDMYNALVTSGDFLGSEKRIFELGLVEERLWGIMLAICDPANENNL